MIELVSGHCMVDCQIWKVNLNNTELYLYLHSKKKKRNLFVTCYDVIALKFIVTSLRGSDRNLVFRLRLNNFESSFSSTDEDPGKVTRIGTV